MINPRSFQLVADVSNIIVQWRLGVPPRQIARWTRHRMEASGPLMTKLGQMVACRRDILPSEVTQEFKPLLKSVKPVPYDDIIDLVPGGVTIERRPLATASIAQVHLGTYKGQKVAVKIKKTSIDADVLRDIETVRTIVQTSTWIMPPLRDVDSFLSEFSMLMHEEIDFVKEAAKMRAYQDNSNPIIVTPVVFEEVCTEDVIVMQYVPSQTIDSFKSSASIWQRRNAANALMHAYIHRLLTKGAFHGDLHEGNVGFIEDGRIVLYDFGSVTTFSQSSRTFLRHACMHIMSGDVNSLVSEMIERGIILPINKEGFDNSDTKIIQAYVTALRTYVFDTNLKNAVDSITVVAGSSARSPFRFAPSFVLMLRSISMLEGVCKTLDPSFSYAPSLVGLLVTDAGTSVFETRAKYDLHKVVTGLFSSDEDL